MSAPSLWNSVKQLQSILSREDKSIWIKIAFFSCLTTFLELAVLMVIISFARILFNPSQALGYIKRFRLPFLVDLVQGMTPGKIVFYGAIICGLTYIIKHIAALADVLYCNFSIRKMGSRFREKLLRRYAEADYGFFLKRGTSVSINVVASDSMSVFTSGMAPLVTIFSNALCIICILMVVVVWNPTLSLFVFVLLGGGCWLVGGALLPLFYRLGKKMQGLSSRASQNLRDFFLGIKEVILLGKRDVFIHAYQRESHNYLGVQALADSIGVFQRMAIELLFVGIFLSIIAYLCLKNDTPPQMLGTLGAYFYASFRLIPCIIQIISSLSMLRRETPAIERAFHEQKLVVTKGTYADEPDLTFDHCLSLENVSFSYDDGRSFALENISLDIRRGEKVGIVGHTGAGKSTLVDVLLGLVQPFHGKILLDGRYSVHSHQWHGKIGYVPQNLFLVTGSIETNIAFGEEEISQERLEKAIHDAQMRGMLERLPQGKHTVLGETAWLSGGERQRVAIARALYRDPQVLIFDEATSALDSETEGRVMKTIEHVREGRTVIMVAHRLTTLRSCDRIFVLKKGRLEATLSYDELISREKQIFQQEIEEAQNSSSCGACA